MAGILRVDSRNQASCVVAIVVDCRGSYCPFDSQVEEGLLVMAYPSLHQSLAVASYQVARKLLAQALAFLMEKLAASLIKVRPFRELAHLGSSQNLLVIQFTV